MWGLTRLMQAHDELRRAACNLGQDVPETSSGNPDRKTGREFFSGTRALQPDPQAIYQDAARLAVSSLRPGPMVEETDTFLT